MAIVSNTLIGRTKKSVGNVSFKKWKDRNVIATKRGKSTTPATQDQLTQQSFFTLMSSVAKLLNFILVIGFKKLATSMTERNFFMKVNNMLQRDYWNQFNALDIVNLIVGQGSLPVPTSVAGVTLNPNQTQVEFTFTTHPSEDATKYAYRLAILSADATELKLEYGADLVDWSPITITIPTPIPVVASDMLYVIYYRKGTYEVCNSVAVGVTA